MALFRICFVWGYVGICKCLPAGRGDLLVYLAVSYGVC